MSSEYEDFSIQIESVGDRFQVRILASPRGSGLVEGCELPMPIDSLSDSLDSLERSLRRSTEIPAGGDSVGRDLSQPDMPAHSEAFSPMEFGSRLYEGLLRGEIREYFTKCFGRVEERPSIGLRLRLNINPRDAALTPWFAMPWELLCRSDKNDLFGLDVRTPIVRYLTIDRPFSALPPVDTVRILVVAPKPRGMVELLSNKEIRNLSAEWQREPNIEIQHLEGGTLGALRDTIVAKTFHIIHFIGHGDFDERSGEGVLFFESETGGRRAVTGRMLATALVTQGRVRIAVLNACESAQFTRNEGQNPFSGVASALLLSGIPAVIAHQFKISDAAALVFSKAFYRALARGYPVDNAITQARHALYLREAGNWEWIIPALYLSTPDGDVLSLRRAHEEVNPQPRPQVDPVATARTKIELAQYRGAIEILEEALSAGETAARIYFYLALAQLAGRRPRELSFDAYDHVEKDLKRAQALPDMGAEVLYLLALIKEDHFAWAGRVLSLPTPEQCLDQADLRTADLKELQLILDVMPETPGLARPRIRERLARSSG